MAKFVHTNLHTFLYYYAISNFVKKSLAAIVLSSALSSCNTSPTITIGNNIPRPEDKFRTDIKYNLDLAMLSLDKDKLFMFQTIENAGIVVCYNVNNYDDAKNLISKVHGLNVDNYKTIFDLMNSIKRKGYANRKQEALGISLEASLCTRYCNYFPEDSEKFETRLIELGLSYYFNYPQAMIPGTFMQSSGFNSHIICRCGKCK